MARGEAAPPVADEPATRAGSARRHPHLPHLEWRPGSARRPSGSLLVRSADLRRITVAFVVSTSSDQFTLVALLWYVLQVTNSPLALSAVVLANRVPASLSAPAVGRLLDRLSPVKLMVAHSLARAAFLLVIPVLHAVGLTSLLGIMLPAFCLGLLAPLTDVGVRVVIPRLVPLRELTAANGILAIGEQFPFLVGPALGGVFVGVLGANALLLPALGSVLVARLLRKVGDGSTVPAGAPPATQSDETLGTSGFKLLVRNPAVRALLLLTFAYFFAYGPLEPALPLYARDHLHAGGGGYGALWSAVGAGAIAGLVLVKPLSRLRPGIVNAAGAIGWGVLLVPLPWVHSLTPALVVLFFAGVVWAPYIAIEASVIQQLMPPATHGTVFGARRSAMVLASPSGAAVGGAMLRHLPADMVILASGLACVAAGAACLAAKSVRAVTAP